ncbi:unnamed protein product (macronuclear) [Paramecium tetraurelia]|uniref:Chromosome undetermined scaffold_151, whole genome shotgun sequence n=1 Tax=Paramecium tetraurelia TaxID=5888 RepID=A0C6B3_PARTE|nr:uncharacterized protein GSPATT00035459001 [Paramecium tetraurelia]XP_001441344.1 uncharacterized protein GSPATT00038965001 [Paramecium tetraurelia]CAK66330.1 unnamed protein product [Paramecium tetraurelia]CAK73947.1 unnamed protein product [Paramecium tetraurelia]|eukprot:XP_001433727.1 hypothetical protein (macronuclear) [Paramecium tetraurelia strain d4-2]
MDIQLRYQNDQTVFNGVESYDDLQQEIQLKYPLLINIELTYQDEEGDVIQVSNTSDIIAITDLSKVILQMDAQIDYVKLGELERLEREEDQRQRLLQDRRNLLQYEIKKEMENYEIFNLEKSANESKYNEEIEELMDRCKKLKDTEREPIIDFKIIFQNSNILGLIREKESNLLLMEDKTGFDTKLQSIQREVDDAFGNLLQQRILDHQAKHNNWIEKKCQINKIYQELQILETEKQEQLERLDMILKRSQENMAKMKAQLNQPPSNDDYQFDSFMF